MKYVVANEEFRTKVMVVNAKILSTSKVSYYFRNFHLVERLRHNFICNFCVEQSKQSYDYAHLLETVLVLFAILPIKRITYSACVVRETRIFPKWDARTFFAGTSNHIETSMRSQNLQSGAWVYIYISCNVTNVMVNIRYFEKVDQ